VKLGEFVETSPPRVTSPDAPLAITQGEEGEEPVGKNNNNLEGDSEGESNKEEQKQKEQNEQKNAAEGSKPKVKLNTVIYRTWTRVTVDFEFVPVYNIHVKS
jgi:hypothetical protein